MRTTWCGRRRLLAREGGAEVFCLRVAAEDGDGVLELLRGDGAEGFLRRALVRAVGAVERLPVVEDRLVQQVAARARGALPGHARIGGKCAAETAEDRKDGEHCQGDAGERADVAARPEERQAQDAAKEPGEERREQERGSEARPELVLLHRRREDRRAVVLPPVEEHDIEALMEDLVVRDADDEEERHERDGGTAEHEVQAAGRPAPGNRVGHGAEKERQAREERRRLEADARAEPERAEDVGACGAAELGCVEQQEGDAKDHELDVEEDEEPQVQLEGKKKTQMIHLTDRSPAWGRDLPPVGRAAGVVL